MTHKFAGGPTRALADGSDFSSVTGVHGDQQIGLVQRCIAEDDGFTAISPGWGHG